MAHLDEDCSDSHNASNIDILQKEVPPAQYECPVHMDSLKTYKSENIDSKVANGDIDNDQVDVSHISDKCSRKVYKENSTSSKCDLTLSKYHKMVKVGVPLESVIHKMENDGVTFATIDLFVKSQTDAKGNVHVTSKECPVDSKKVHLLAKANDFFGEKPHTPHINVDNIMSKYKTMVSIGIPVASAAHKLKVDGINPEVISNFLAEHQQKTDSYDGQLKTLSQPNPNANHEQAKSDRKKQPTAPNADKQHLSSEECNALFHEDGELTKYRKMATVGVPPQSIANKMRQDGIPAVKIESFEVAFGLKEIKHPTAPNADKQHLSPEECKALFHEDGGLTKYRKMATVGVPPQSIANKMRQDGISAVKIESFEVAFGLKTEIRKTHADEVHPLGLPRPPPVRRTSVKMQKIHWNNPKPEKLRDSLWADSTELDSDIDDKEVKQLESLFRAAPTEPLNATKKNDVKTNKSRLNSSCLIETKRANNIAISLAQYRSFKNYDDLCEAVITMDASKLNAEQLQNMKVLLPSVEEIRKIKEHNGGTEGLVRAELFFLSVIKFPRFGQKLDAFLFSLLFETHAFELEDLLNKLSKACQDVVNNTKLAAILRRLLAVGNLVNEGAGKPRAHGITVDSLLKTAKRTGSDGKTTVIYIVVANFLKQDQSGDSVGFWNEMESVRDAARINIQDCRSALKDIQSGMKRVHHAIDQDKASSATDDDCPNIFLHRCEDFIQSASKKTEKIEQQLKFVEKSVASLCSFFAEDPKSFQVRADL